MKRLLSSLMFLSALFVGASSVMANANGANFGVSQETSTINRFSCSYGYYQNVYGNCVLGPSYTIPTYKSPVYTYPSYKPTYTIPTYKSPVYTYPSYNSGTATCRDGTTSYSQNRSGTCSYHGGVASWGG